MSKCPHVVDFDAVLGDLTSKLTSLRNIIYSIKVVEGVSDTAIWSEYRIQLMMILFLNYVFRTLSVNLEATIANEFIELTVKNNLGIEQKWKGKTDLKCTHPASPDIKDATATLEIKVPFNTSDPRLYHSKALQPKQQLLGQAMGLRSKLSYLTDIISVSVMHHLNDSYHLSQSVTDAEKYCLRLMLMCCGDLGRDEWTNLMQPCNEEVDLMEEDDVEHQTSDDSSIPKLPNNLSVPATAAGPFTRSPKKVDGGHKLHDVACSSFGDENGEARELQLAEYADMLRCEAKCQDRRYLGFDELQQHNCLKS